MRPTVRVSDTNSDAASVNACHTHSTNGTCEAPSEQGGAERGRLKYNRRLDGFFLGLRDFAFLRPREADTLQHSHGTGEVGEEIGLKRAQLIRQRGVQPTPRALGSERRAETRCVKRA